MSAKHNYHQPGYSSWVSLVIISLLLISCGGTTATPLPFSTKPPPTVTLKVANLATSGGAVASLRTGESVAIVVNIDPFEDLTWAWDVSGTSGGSLNTNQGDNVVYQAGQPGIDTISARATRTDGMPIKQSITITVEPTATAIPPATDTPLPPKVTLDTLQDNQKVPCSNLVSGTYPDGLDRAIWPVVYIGGLYHPQDEGGKAALMANGRWTQTVRFGDCLNSPNKDVGTPFQLIIVTANESANAAFEAYIASGKKNGRWPGMPELPPGADEQARITVIRE